MSNVADLRENLVDKVLGLGVGGNFLEHPAFVPALSEVSSLIGQMNIFEPERVFVNEDKGVLSFEYSTPEGDKYSFELRASENQISCVRVEEPHSFVGNSGNVVRQKNAVEILSKLDGSEVTITRNVGLMDNIGCDNKHYNLGSSIERRVYDKHGVMRERESKYYDSRKGEGYFHRVGADELLSYSRWVPQYAAWNDRYTSRTLLSRDTLDVARIVYQDRNSGHEYYGKVPLHQEHGLRDMYIANGFNTYPVPPVTIHPLMESEVEAMIARESDSRVAEGLRKYAEGRTSYSYSSGGEESSNKPKYM